MSTPISTSVTAVETIEQVIANIDSLGQSLNVTLSATDTRFQDFQDARLRETADEALKTIEQARSVLATLQALKEADTETENAVESVDGQETAIAGTPSGDNSTAGTQAAFDNTTAPSYSLPKNKEFETVAVRQDKPADSYFNQANLYSDAAMKFLNEPEQRLQTPLSESSGTGNTPLSSAGNIGTPSSSSGETTLSSAGDTTLSSGDTNNANKYVGYTDTSSNSNTTEYASYTPGVTMSKQNLQDLASIQNKMTYGPEIFDEIWFEDNGGEYYDEYDGYYDDYGYGYVDGYEGEPMLLVGNPTDQTMLDVSQVTYERPQDMTVSKEEFDAIFEEIMWRAAIEDPVAKDKWYQTLSLIAEKESNMNPAAANGWDSNAVGATQSDGYPAKSSRGMFQCIPSTFAANHMGGTSTSIYDPAASMGAAVNYLMTRYGCDRYGNGLDAFYSARVPVYHGY